MDTKNNYKYFMFSNTHLKKNKEIYDKIDKKYQVKKVLVGGVWRQYTDIVSTPKDCHYSDAIVVTHGLLENIKYE